jgi:hypothetical protein
MAVPVPTNFAEISAQILQPGCVSMSCHSDVGETAANMLDLCAAPNPGSMDQALCASSTTLDDAYAALVGVPAVNSMAQSMGLQRVKPCDPDNSFLLIKLTLPESQTDPAVGYGGHMPSGNPLLPTPQVDAIRDWIARGAHEDEPASISGSECVLDVDMSVASTD